MANPCDYNFVRICAQNLNIKKGKVYEFGSFRIENQNEFNNFRPFFPNNEYVGTDIVPGNGVDEIMDICNTGLPDESVDIAISTNVIEHLENPFEALTEMFRILKKDGMFILTSVMKEHIHNWPRDYWRFTPECFKYLLKDYKIQFVTASGDPAFPSIIAGVAWKSDVEIPSKFLAAIEQWKKDYRYPKMSFGLYVKRFVPPIITDYYDKNLYKPLWRIKRKILNKIRIRHF